MLIKKYLETTEINFIAKTKQMTVDSKKQEHEQL